MGSLIFIIIVICAIVSAVKKQQQQTRARYEQQTDPIDPYEHSAMPKQQTAPKSATTPKQTTAAKRVHTEDRSASKTVISDVYDYGRSSGYQDVSSMKKKAGSVTAATSRESAATRKAAERARENMTEQELKSRPSAQEFRKLAGVDAEDGAILSAAKMHSFATELGNEFDSKEDLMKPVYDLMITGPDTSLPNERDFLSEATDMLNAYVTES